MLESYFLYLVFEREDCHRGVVHHVNSDIVFGKHNLLQSPVHPIHGDVLLVRQISKDDKVQNQKLVIWSRKDPIVLCYLPNSLPCFSYRCQAREGLSTTVAPQSFVSILSLHCSL
jgi:hypothetical protein